ncbi:MAG: carbohydrate ABC transporter permease [Thermomicrobiales bacterium]
MLSSVPGRRRQVIVVTHRLVAAVVALLFLLPLIWALSASLREIGAPIPRTIEWIPSPVAWDNYRMIFAVVDLRRFALNSLFVAALAVPVTIVVASMAGFAIAHVSQPWRLRLTALSILCLMVPLTAIWLPRFILFKEAGLINQQIALVVPALMGTSPLYVLLFAWTFMRVPREVYEAARLDGAGPYRVWAQIALPLARPAIVAVAVLSFVHHWNSFVEPLLLIRTTDKMTASLGLRVLYSLDRTNWPLMMTGAVLVMAPVIIVFVFAQRAFQQDVRGRGILGE